MRRVLFLLGGCCLLLATGKAAPTFLFDATKAETAGNADWVIDEDSNVAARYPTPAASGITASTAETYWTGALSSWGVALVQMGYNVEQLPVGGRITYGDTTNAQDLANYQVYVVCEPNVLFTPAEKLALIHFVQAGGSLFVISDHAGSDRNNDGYDSVQIWNDFFTNNGVQANPFGVTINSTDVSVVSTYRDTAADDPLTNGPVGPAAVLQFSDGATMTLNPSANPTVRAAFWSDSAHTNGNVMAAWGTFGAGRFVVETDSSPPDDGSGGSGHTLYPGWTEQGVNHSNLFLNASVWLAKGQTGTGTPTSPANDNFANAAVLTGTSPAGSGSNVNATLETGEPAADYGSLGGHTIWWKWTAPADLIANLFFSKGSIIPCVDVYTGSTLGSLKNVVFAARNSGFGFGAKAGATYFLRCDCGTDGATGPIFFSLLTQATPTASLTATTPQAAEYGAVPGVFTIKLNHTLAYYTETVSFTVGGTATNFTDYALSYASPTTNSVQILPGQTSATVTIKPVDDDDPTEGNETVVLTLSPSSDYALGSTATSDTVTIQDDSPYSPTWETTYRPHGFSGASAAPLADPDHDGVPNLLEFAFNLNPLAADGPAAQPASGTGLFTDPTDSTGTLRRFPTLTFTRRTDAPNLTYTVETTSDLAASNWTATTPVFVSSTKVNMPANTEQAVYRAPLPLDGPNAAPRQFLRVRVTSAPAQAAASAATGAQQTAGPTRRDPP